ncbi:hypothetical protein [Paenibacillus brevis]|uniref:F0F1-type ATP synthase n=1 Tax=Paenibacillus brevis TaxID=2841508 RepID=A0ABS6FR95_9BACL|nr:hypothetical protein [Paenibacillus brevis]MBU5672499.1 hypothetical protein [Paenibacillus brevis]
MKITDWSLIFVIILLPLCVVTGWNTAQLRQARVLEIQYTTALRTAVQDAGVVLTRNYLQADEYGYASDKQSRVNKEEALSVLRSSLGYNFGIADDSAALDAFMLYIPAIIVIDYDGYYMYELADEMDGSNVIQSSHQWMPKKPFIYEDKQGYSAAFTLDDQVAVIDHQTGEQIQGKRGELPHVLLPDLLSDPVQFDQLRRSAIVHSIEQDLSRAIESHNTVVRQLGWTYLFTMPTISQEDWSNTLDEPGMLVFLQGIPAGVSRFNNYALGGGRVVRAKEFLAGKDPVSGFPYASSRICNLPFAAEEVYVHRRNAAEAGYYEWNCR